MASSAMTVSCVDEVNGLGVGGSWDAVGVWMGSLIESLSSDSSSVRAWPSSAPGRPPSSMLGIGVGSGIGAGAGVG